MMAMIIVIVIFFMIMVMKMAKKYSHDMTLMSKYTNLKEYYLVGKGPTNSGIIGFITGPVLPHSPAPPAPSQKRPNSNGDGFTKVCFVFRTSTSILG